VCAITCSAGYTKCGNTCKSLATDAANCGTCGRVCGAPGDGTSPACSGGKCKKCTLQNAGPYATYWVCTFSN
jgi:hypothetical protein